MRDGRNFSRKGRFGGVGEGQKPSKMAFLMFFEWFGIEILKKLRISDEIIIL